MYRRCRRRLQPPSALRAPTLRRCTCFTVEMEDFMEDVSHSGSDQAEAPLSLLPIISQPILCYFVGLYGFWSDL